MKQYIRTSIVQDITQEPLSVRLKLAKDSDTSVRLLRRLIQDPDERIRFCIAENTKDSEILRELSKDTDPDVVESVALNEHTPKDALAEISNCELPYLRLCVAENGNTSLDTLNKLVKDSEFVVRCSAAGTLRRLYPLWFVTSAINRTSFECLRCEYVDDICHAVCPNCGADMSRRDLKLIGSNYEKVYQNIYYTESFR